MTLLFPPVRPGRLGLLGALVMAGAMVLVGVLSYAGLIVLKETVDPSRIGWGGGQAYVYNFTNPLIVKGLFIAPADDMVGDIQKSIASTLTLLEDGRPLGPAHSLQGTIGRQGGGAFSHCMFGQALLFSSSDNSDPRNNGRHYLTSTPIRMALPLFKGAVLLFSILLILATAPWVARRSSPFEGYGEGERVWLFCLGAALALFAVPLLGFDHKGCPEAVASLLSCLKTRDRSLFVYAFLLLPFLVWGFYSAIRHLESRGWTGTVDLVILVNALIAIPALAMLTLRPGLAPWFGPLAPVAGAVLVVLGRGLPALPAFAGGPTGVAIVRLSTALAGVALVALPIGLDEGSRTWFLTLVRSPWFALGALAGLAAVASLVLRKTPGPAWPLAERRVFAIAILAVVAGSYQPSLMGEWTHIDSYLGPTLSVLDGQVPLVGAQCLYGLSFLVFVAGFHLGIEPSYAGIVFISSLLNAAELVVFMLLVRHLTRKPVLAACCGLGVLLLIQTLCPWNNLTPSGGGTRFLPPLALALALTTHQRKGPTALAPLLCLVWCVLWSVETCIWGLVTVAAAILARNLPLGSHWRRMARELACAVGTSVLAVLAVCALVWLWAGEPPRLNDYFQMVFSHVDVGGSTSGEGAVTWNKPVPNDFLYWLPLGLVLVLVLVAGVAALLSARTQPLSVLLLPIIPLAALAVTEWTYFIGRSLWSVLLISSLPAAAVAAAAFALALPFVRKTARAVLVLVAAVVAMAALGTGFGGLGFVGDITKLVTMPAEMMPAPFWLASGRGLGLARLADFLSGNHPPGPVDVPLYRAVADNPSYRHPGQDTYVSYIVDFTRDMEDIARVIDRHAAPHQPIVIIDARNYSTAALIFSSRPNRLPISKAANDQISPSRIAYLAALAPSLVHDGEEIFVGPDYRISDGLAVPDLEPDHRLGYAILISLNAKWTFSLIEDGPLLHVYRLTRRAPTEAPTEAPLP